MIKENRPRLYEGATPKELDRFQNTPQFTGDVVVESVQTPGEAQEQSFHVSERAQQVDIAEKRIEHQLMPRSHKLWDWNKSRLVHYSVEDGAIVVKYSNRDVTTVAVVISEVELITTAWLAGKYKVYPCRVYRRPSGKLIALALQDKAVDRYQPLRALLPQEDALTLSLAKMFPKTVGASRHWKYHKDSQCLHGNWEILGGPDGITPGWADLDIQMSGLHPIAVFYKNYRAGSGWLKKGRKAVAVNKAAYVNGRWHSVKAKGDILLLQKWYDLGGKVTPKEMGLCNAPPDLMILRAARNKAAGSYWTLDVKPHISGGVVREMAYYMDCDKKCFVRYSDIILYPNGATQETNVGDYEFFAHIIRVEKA